MEMDVGVIGVLMWQIWIRDTFRKGLLELERKGGVDWGKVTWSAWKCAEQS